MKHVLMILMILVTLISCDDNKKRDTNTPSSTDSSSTLDISRKSGNNTGVQDSSFNKTDSTKERTDTLK